MIKLTKRQNEILTLIESHMAKTGSPPTRAEIAKTMGFRSPNAAEDHLRALARKGVIELVPGTSRGIRVISKSSGLPIIRDLKTRGDLLDETNIASHSKIDRHLFSPAIDFIYRMNNNEMAEFGFQEGDLIAFHKTHTAISDQWVLLRINGEIILRRYSEALEAQHPRIEGHLVGLIRALPGSSIS